MIRRTPETTRTDTLVPCTTLFRSDVDFQKAVSKGVAGCFLNSGQSCNAPTRMFVPLERMDEVKQIAKTAAEGMKVGDPRSEETQLGPVVSQILYEDRKSTRLNSSH